MNLDVFRHTVVEKKTGEWHLLGVESLARVAIKYIFF